MLVVLAIVSLGVYTNVAAIPSAPQEPQQQGLPNIQFLGEGPGTFNVQAPREFLIKTYQNGQFLFVTDPGPTYKAKKSERVWTTDFMPNEPFRLFDELRSYGQVPAGCQVNYVQIEDNVDNRRNSFFINGNLLKTVDQGMVTYGSVTVPEAGELTFFAEDSIGLLVQLCANLTQTPGAPGTPTAGTTTTTPGTTTTTPGTTLTVAPPPAQSQTVTVTVTVPAATATYTPVPPTATATFTQVPPTTSPTVQPPSNQEPTFTPTGSPPTATNVPPTATTVPPTATTAPPTATSTVEVAPPPAPTNTNTPSLGPTATTAPPANTATPNPTPGTIPLSGEGPGPAQVASITLALIAGFGLVGVAWWSLLRWNKNGK